MDHSCQAFLKAGHLPASIFITCTCRHGTKIVHTFKKMKHGYYIHFNIYSGRTVTRDKEKFAAFSFAQSNKSRLWLNMIDNIGSVRYINMAIYGPK
jgi:hypothetical protein